MGGGGCPHSGGVFIGKRNLVAPNNYFVCTDLKSILEDASMGKYYATFQEQEVSFLPFKDTFEPLGKKCTSL